MGPFDALSRASDEFERRLRGIDTDQWDRSTPCEGWTVRDLVRHVVAGNRMAVLLLRGGERDEVIEHVKAFVVTDPVDEAFARSAEEQAAAFKEPGAFDRTCHHPAGDIPGVRLLGFRVGDLTVHAWDLARALGADEQLDPELVDMVWESMAPMAPFISQTGFFGEGPTGALDDTAPPQVRLLDLGGRRP